MLDIGERIRFVRTFRGMSQTELAGKIGLGANENGRTRISQYENGKRVPKEELLEKISDALDVDSLYLSTKVHTHALDIAFDLLDWDNVEPIEITRCEDGDGVLIKYDDFMFKNFFKEWAEKQAALKEGIITKEQYIEWKINFGSTQNK